MQRILRLEKEIKSLNKQPLTNIAINSNFESNKENDINLNAQIIGGKESFYDGGVFELEIIIPERYPFIAPKIKFLTPIYHPNIDQSGRICLELLTQQKEWTPKYNLSYLLLQIQALMSKPNFDDPLQPELAYLFKTNPTLFKKNAFEFTKQNANKQKFNLK